MALLLTKTRDHSNLASSPLPSVTFTDWHGARDSFTKLAPPEIVEIIDALSPDNRFPIAQLHYPYGATIFQNNVFQLPSHSPADAQSLWQNDFAIATQLPFMFVADKSLEATITLNNRSFPLQYVPAGTFLGLEAGLLNQTNLPKHYHLSAGARQIFSLPKIGACLNHKRLLKTLQIKAPCPQDLYDHFETFRALTQSRLWPCDWQSQLYVFGRSWLSQKKDPAWQSFYYTLLQYYLKQQCRHTYLPDLSFLLNDVLEKMHRSYETTILKHTKRILCVAAGLSDSLCFATDEQAAPIGFLSTLYKEIYRLHPYTPCFMHPQSRYQQTTAHYYSLSQYPVASNEEAQKKLTHRQMLLQIKSLLEACHTLLRDPFHHPKASVLEKYYLHRHFSYYHPQACLEIQDPRDLANLLNISSDAFSTSSPLLKGLIRIT